MLFKPEKTRLWDTFILEHDSKFYLFYLSLTERAWDGYGLAISDDLIHWEDRGLILEADPDVIGMGSGSVWRAGDRWILNFSYGEQGSQRIYFAESNDLLTWHKLPKDIICAPDPRWYECTGETSSTNARWDNIWAVPQEDGSFIGFVVASGKDGPAGANGVAGVVSSSDGVHWVTEKPATEPCGMVWAEASCYFKFEDRHYLLVGSTTGLGPRFDPIYNSSGKAGGMYVMMSDSIRGPYKLVDGDPLLLGCRNAPPNWAYIPTYYARVLETDGQYLLYHHWMPRADFLDSWLGTMKVVKEDAPGRLSLHYWDRNDKLKGDLIFDLENANPLVTPSPQPIRASSWVYSSGKLTSHTDSSTLAYYELSVDYSSGVVIEADISINGPGAAGIFFGIDEQTDDRPYEGVACLANKRGLYEFGRVTSGIAGPTFMAENHILHDVPQNTTMKWRILLRDEFVEWYVDDQLVQCYGFSSPASHNIGVFTERCQVELINLTVHKFA